MKNLINKVLIGTLCLVLMFTSCRAVAQSSALEDEQIDTIENGEGQRPPRPEQDDNKPSKPDEGDEKQPRPDEDGERPPREDGDKDNNEISEENKEKKQGENQTKNYNIEQAISDNAQLKTIAFSGLAFITGSAGADSFFPPGKVADFSGFQYMRDNDQNGLGHNTTFLTIAATNMMNILDEQQLEKLTELATTQEKLFEDFALGRFNLMVSFRDYMEGDIPDDVELDRELVSEYCSSLYEIDADLSYERAKVMGEIISSFSDEQKAYLNKLDFNDSSTWPVIENGEDIIDKRSMTHTQHVAVMTYASEMFSWYMGNIDADAYFCPERHGTYFGGFYMKDYHAMGNPDYFISTTVTGDSGQEFLNILNDEQKAYITELVPAQKDSVNRIVEIRYAVAKEFRKGMTGEEINKNLVYDLISEYGYLDGEISYMYADAFAKIKSSLTQEQLDEMYVLRNLDIYPKGAFLYSEPISMPVVNDADRLFN